jgi:hypothetical protein
MPKVTLLGRADRTYLYVLGTMHYSFKAGVPVEVPVKVALDLSKKMDGRRPRFNVEELPTIIQTNHTPPDQAAIMQNVCSGPRQLRFGSWL